jgi:beta-galactosidase
VTNEGNSQTDDVVTTIGIREVYFDPDMGLFLNERPLKIHGVCNHQDFGMF